MNPYKALSPKPQNLGLGDWGAVATKGRGRKT